MGKSTIVCEMTLPDPALGEQKTVKGQKRRLCFAISGLPYRAFCFYNADVNTFDGSSSNNQALKYSAARVAPMLSLYVAVTEINGYALRAQIIVVPLSH